MIINFRSIHFRLTFWYVSLLMIILAVFGILVYFSLAHILNKNIDESIQSQAEWIAGIMDMLDEGLNFEEFKEDLTEHTAGRENGQYIQILKTSGEIIYQSEQISHVLQISEEARHRASESKRTLETITEPNMGILRLVTLPVEDDEKTAYLIQVGTSIKEIKQTLRQLLLALIGSGLIALIASVFVGQFLARRALKPVDDITTTAKKIETENLSQRLVVPSTGDEISRLAFTLNEMIGRLEQSFKQIRQFTADASHELRTPLTAMRGQTEVILKKKRTSEEYQQVLESNLEEMEWMSRIIENLLTLSRTDAGEIRLVIQPVQLDELINETYENCRPLADAKDIGISIDTIQAVTIPGDKMLLRQMSLNLIDNAIKYTPTSGQIWLSLEVVDKFAKLQIKDTGIGISQEDLPHIFDRFFRVDKARSRETGGSGLGLSIVQWIVKAHHGNIEVTSKPGEGSCFTIRLPLEN